MTQRDLELKIANIRMKTGLIMFAFLAMITAIAAFYPFSFMDRQARAADVMHNIINALFASWLGDVNTVILLAALTLILPILYFTGALKSYSEWQIRKALSQAQIHRTQRRPAQKSQVLFGSKK